MSESEKVGDGHLGCSAVVDADGVDLEVYREPVKTDDGKVRGEGAPPLWRHLLPACGYEQDALDALRSQKGDHLGLTVGAAFGVEDDEEISSFARGGFGAADN